MLKIHKKLFKAGKLWLVATVCALGVGFAVNASADQLPSSTLDLDFKVVPSATTTTPTPSQTSTSTNEAVNENVAHLDGYSASRSNQYPNGGLDVSGWQATNASQQEPYRYLILYDNTTNRELSRQQVNQSVTRADVQRVYPNVHNSLNSGFSQQLLLPSSAAANGDTVSVVSRYSNDSVHGEGIHTDYWFSPIKLDNSNRAFLDGVSIANNQVNVRGWNASNQSYTYPRHYIIALDANTGREIGRQLVTTNNTRNDVARAFPTILNAAYSGFNVNFPLNSQFINDRVQFISRWTRSNDGNSDYVDYWFSPVQLVADHSNRGWLDTLNVQNHQLHVSGWHATNLSLGRNYHTIIVLDANNHELARQTVSHGQRPDVARAFPSIATASDSGFSANFPLQSAMVNGPLHIVSRWSATPDANENYVDYWFTGSLNQTKHAAWLDNLSENGTMINASGWHVDDRSALYPYHFIILYDISRDRELARHQVINTASPDVARVYGDISNSGDSRFSTSFTIDPSNENDKLQLLSRYSDSPDGNGNYAQMWLSNLVLNCKCDLVGNTLFDNFGRPHQIPTDNAEHVARVLADIVNQSGERTDKRRVQLAALYVSFFCARDNYTMSGPYYSKPEGVFIKGEYSCAGATRALGLVLSDLGYRWHHEHENEYTHQWCTLMMDGRMGWADGQDGSADYGNKNDETNDAYYDHGKYNYWAF